MKKIKFVPSKIHGVLDYLVDVVLVSVPLVMDFGKSSSFALYIPIAIGILNLLYSLCTEYHFGLLKVIPFKSHLALDFLVGIPLIITAVFVGINSLAGGFNLLMGVGIILAVLFSKNDA